MSLIPHGGPVGAITPACPQGLPDIHRCPTFSHLVCGGIHPNVYWQKLFDNGCSSAVILACLCVATNCGFVIRKECIDKTLAVCGSCGHCGTRLLKETDLSDPHTIGVVPEIEVLRHLADSVAGQVLELVPRLLAAGRRFLTKGLCLDQS
jgi:hypothetical protein